MQLTLIVTMGGLFFVAGIALQRGAPPSSIAAACVAVLLLIVVIVRKSAPPEARAGISTRSDRPGSKARSLAVIAGIGLIELTQVSASPQWVRVMAIVAAIGVFIWAFLHKPR